MVTCLLRMFPKQLKVSLQTKLDRKSAWIRKVSEHFCFVQQVTARPTAVNMADSCRKLSASVKSLAAAEGATVQSVTARSGDNDIIPLKIKHCYLPS